MTHEATSQFTDATPASPRWHDIADRAGVGLLRTDPAGRVLDMSPAATRMLDRGMDALRGIELASLAEPGQRSALQAAFDAVRNGDDAVSRDIRYVRPHGESCSTLSRFAAVRDTAGVVRAITVVLIALGDAHVPSVDTGDSASVELRHAMEALRVSEDRYRRLFESIDQGFCVIEVMFEGERAVDYRFLEVNPAFERYTGLTHAVGKRMRELAPTHEEHWFGFYGDVVRTGQPADTILPARALDDRWYQVHAFPFGARGSHRVAVLFEDISSRRRTELALRESEELFRRIANVAPSMLWTATANGETTWLSERWSDYTG
jgi:PAS domain S-box-containing protein